MRKMKEYPESHTTGHITIESIPNTPCHSDLGIQIAKDGRVWICIDGMAFLRFTPDSIFKIKEEKCLKT
uniref:Uncharacterized protein n=1 Tax=viral metagenome TaxID=1070528 RepID=A0A6M3ITI6_9ZZZZ